MRRILVTGASGQIGSELVPALRARHGHDFVVASDIRVPAAGEIDEGHFEHVDCTHIREIDYTVRRHDIGTIYHLAALLSATAEEKPRIAWEVNMGGLYRVLEVARSHHCAVFLPSSIGAFGPTTPARQTPQDTIQRPTTVYGITKVSSELGDRAFKLRSRQVREVPLLVNRPRGVNLLGAHSHLHLSGILACIFATITVHHVMTQAVVEENRQIDREEAELQLEARSRTLSSTVIDNVLNRIKATIEERDRHLRTKEDVQLLALVANTILFVAMAEMIDLALLWKYRWEILVMFLGTTLIRAVMMGLFAWITNKTHRMTDVGVRWWGVLTFAGIKGGLSIVMLTMIPASFEHLEMFKAVVIGVIMLSTFIYSGILLAIIGTNSDAFRLEKDAEAHNAIESRS